jgi:hypothetical protein
MSSRYLIIVGLMALLATGCMEAKMKEAREMITWKTMDSVFQYIIPIPGKVKFSKGDSVQVQVIAVLNNSSNGTVPVDTNYIDKDCIRFAETATLTMLEANTNGIIKKPEAGQLMADFSAIDWRKDFIVTAYLEKNIKQSEIDTLLKKIRRLPEIHRAEFISKEEAKKRWLASGEKDFTKELDENPLPASIAMTIEPDYLKESAMKELVDGFKEKFPDQVISTLYPVKFLMVIECSRRYTFLISYKT